MSVFRKLWCMLVRTDQVPPEAEDAFVFEPGECVLVRTEARQMAIVSPGRVRYESIFEVFQDNGDQEEATVTFFTNSAERRAGFNEWMQGHADRQEVEGFLKSLSRDA